MKRILLILLCFPIIGFGQISFFNPYQKFYIEPLEKEAHSEIYMAELYFKKNSFNLALNGDGRYAGFLDIADDYSSTNIGKLANYYAGICYLQIGEYESAIEYLEYFSSNDIILSSLALGCIGDAYMELGNTKNAMDAYENAVENSNNEFTAPRFKMKLAIIHQLNGDYSNALEIYRSIIRDFKNYALEYGIKEKIIRIEENKIIKKNKTSTEDISNHSKIAEKDLNLKKFFKKITSSKNNETVGEVYGKTITIQEFQSKVDAGVEDWKLQNQKTVLSQTIIIQIRDQIWSQYVRDLVMEYQFEKLGIDVSDDEFFELLQGANVHTEISKIPSFQDPNTGQFDRTRVLTYLKEINKDPTSKAKRRWLKFQEYIIRLVRSEKYKSLVSKSMFITNDEARYDYKLHILADLRYYKNSYNALKEDANVKDYRESFYKTSYNRDPIVTKEQIIRELEYLKINFETSDDYELMVEINSDNTNSRFVYTVEEKLQDPIWIDLFNADKGTVLGPYLVRPGVYRIAKLVEVEYRPDSVEARHIMIKAPTQKINLDSAQRILDELILKIENGSDFGNLAQKYSEDRASAIKGGDLGWFQEGIMVDEFNEVCFTSKIGNLTLVNTRFGLHLIEITRMSKKVRKIKVAFIDKNLKKNRYESNQYKK